MRNVRQRVYTFFLVPDILRAVRPVFLYIYAFGCPKNTAWRPSRMCASRGWMYFSKNHLVDCAPALTRVSFFSAVSLLSTTTCKNTKTCRLHKELPRPVFSFLCSCVCLSPHLIDLSNLIATHYIQTRSDYFLRGIQSSVVTACDNNNTRFVFLVSKAGRGNDEKKKKTYYQLLLVYYRIHFALDLGTRSSTTPAVLGSFCPYDIGATPIVANISTSTRIEAIFSARVPWGTG